MVLPTFVQCALTGQSLPIHGDGQQERTFSDVGQAVELLWAAVVNSDCRGQIVNVATNAQPISILELAKLVGRVVGKDIKCEFIPHDVAFGAAYDDVICKRPALHTLRHLVGHWEPVPLENTVRNVLEDQVSSGTTVARPLSDAMSAWDKSPVN
jgi:UDP-glucose 4-epimerase